MERASGRSNSSTVRQHVSSAYRGSNLTFGPPPSNITFVNAAASGSVSFNTSFTATAPTSIVQGNLLVATFSAIGESAFITPSGWTLVGSQLTTNEQIAVYSKVAGPSEPSTYTFNTTSSAWHEIVIAQYHGATKVDGSVVFGGANAATIVAGSVTPTGSNEWWLTAFGQDGNRTVSSAPAGATLRGTDVVSGTGIWLYDNHPFSSATGTATLTWLAGTQASSASFLLQ